MQPTVRPEGTDEAHSFANLDGHSMKKGLSLEDRQKMDHEIARLRTMLRRVINPNGRFLRRWDAVKLVTLILIALLTPVEIALTDSSILPIFLCNRVIDIVLVSDIIVNFVTPYRESPKKGARWVYNPRTIGKHYLRHSFLFHLMTTIPTDLMLLDCERGTPEFSWRAVRVLRLARVVQLSGIVDRYVQTTAIDLSVLELIKFGFYTIVTAHWLACAWAYVGHTKPSTPTDLDTWYIADRDDQSWIQKHQLSDASAAELYTVCLYVALSNIFGGPCEINPANYREFLAQSLMMFVGSSLWAYIIGCGVSIVATLSPHKDEHRRIIGMLNHYVRDKSLDSDLTSRLRNYFNETAAMRYFANKNEELMLSMTSHLRGEASFISARAIFAKVWYFNPDSIVMRGVEVEEEFFSKLSLASSVLLFARKEQINCEHLLIIDRGLIARGGQIGMTVVGEDMILSQDSLRDLRPATALTSLVQVLRIDRSDLRDLLDVFPNARRCIRKAAIRVTFQRTVLATAAFVRGHMRDRNKGTPRGLYEAFSNWLESSKISHVHSYEIKSKVEKQVAEVEEQLQDLGTKMNARFDELLSSLANGKRQAARPKKVSKGKSVPPPLPRSSPLNLLQSITPPPISSVEQAASNSSRQFRPIHGRPNSRPNSRSPSQQPGQSRTPDALLLADVASGVDLGGQRANASDQKQSTQDDYSC